MIYRLTYCNKDGVEARVDIQKGSSTPVIEVEGTERPFILSYNNDKGNKSGMFLSSSADIEIYETTDFNIDNLKTSNETELAVTYYINNIVKWKGFIIPDFFSIEVRSNPVITMTASDRLGTLKNVTLDDLPTMVNIRELTLTCLSKTGLSLPLKTIADFSNDGTVNAFFSYYVDSQRIKDIKGRSISCYDILSSILIASNSKLVQRAGEWVIINKLQHEIGSGKIYSSLSSFTNYLENIYNFEEVSIGARRTIMPVAGSVGIYHEHGGRKSHPANYDFSLGLSGWNSVNGFVATIENRHIIGFLGGTPLFDTERTVKQYLLNYNNWIDDTNNLNTAPYISTDPIQINSPRADRVEVTVDISSIMAEKLSSNTAISFLRYAVILTNGVKTYTLTKAGIFEILDPENISGHSLLLRGGQQHPLLLASPAFSNSDSFKGLFEVGEDDDVNNYSATIRVYGSGDQYVTVNYALIKFSDVSELPKGTMYKTEQGEVFTKAYDIETSIFGDYLLSGLDGYFYRYPNDDTSSIYKDVNTLSSPIWTTPSIPNETSELPLLHHSMRQMRRMFSVAHDLLSAEIEASNFDPLAIFVSCGKRYTVVSAQFDFFKSNLSVELEEVAFQNNVIREYIYSYFGEGESGIKSIGGISAGGSGGGTGGGLTPEQLEILSWWKKDPDNPNTIYTEMNAYSMGELSAYGIGSGGSSGGGVDLLQAWTDYDATKDNWAVKAGLLVPFYNDTKGRLTSLEGGAALSLSTVGTGNGIANITKSGTVLTVTKANFAELDTNGKIISSQLPSYVDDVLEYVNLAAFPATGETGKIYIAQDSNKTYRWSGTAYVEISASLALGETSSTAYRGDRGKIAYDHSQSEHQTIINGTGFVKANGKTLSYDNNSYSLASHNHSGVYEPVLGNPAANGYLLSSSTAGARSWVAPYSLPTASASVLGGVKIGANVSIASGVISVHNPLTIGTANGLSLSTQVLSLALATTAASGALSSTDKTYIELLKTFFEYDSTNNAIKALKSLYSTGEVSAYGIGSGGSGGSYDRLDTWASYDGTKAGWVLSALLGNELNTRVGNLEGGSALTVNTTGAGNAITSISKAGTAITATKGLTFSLDGHTHAYLPLTGGTLTGNVIAPTFQGSIKTPSGVEYLSVGTNISAVGWYRVFISSMGNAGGSSVILNVNRSYTYASNESYTFSINVAYNGAISITQLSGVANARLISKIRVDYVNNGMLAVDIYYNLANRNAVYISGSGIGQFQAPSLVSSPTGTTIEFDTVDGVKSNIGFTGSLTGNASSAIKLQTPRTIAGVSFDGTANIAIPFANLSSKPTTLAGYGITDFTSHNNSTPINSADTTVNAIGYTNSVSLFGQNDGGLINIAYSTAWQSQIFQDFRTGQIALRGKNFGTWTDWRTVLDSENYNSYSPSKTGTGASGTWNINVTGNASSATKLQTPRTIWGQSFDGSGNVSGALSGATTGVFSSTVQATTAILTNLTANYLPKHTASGLVNSLIYDNGTNVGLGNISPSEKLEVSGNIKSSGKIDALSIGSKFGNAIASLPALGAEGNTFGIGSGYGFRFNVLTTGDGNLQVGRFSGGTNAYNLILQSQGGNVGIGEPSPSVKLHVAGNILSTGEITAYVASDRRLKHNITPLSSSLDIIDKLNPVSYYWNAKAKELNPMKSDSLDYGLIAQEVENVLPGVVHGIFDDKYKSIDYIKLIPIMIAAIKELKQKVNKL